MKSHLKPLNDNEQHNNDGNRQDDENYDANQMDCEQFDMAANVMKMENVVESVTKPEIVVKIHNLETMENIENIAIAEIPLLESDINALCDNDFVLQNEDELKAEDIQQLEVTTTSKRIRRGRPSRMNVDVVERVYECSVCHVGFAQKKEFKVSIGEIITSIAKFPIFFKISHFSKYPGFFKISHFLQKFPFFNFPFVLFSIKTPNNTFY